MTDNNSHKKITWHVWFLVGMIVLGIIFKIYASYWPHAVVKVNGYELKVLLADTPDHRYSGCSNRDNLGKYDGMLFVFAERAQHAMVMRQMRFPLDIIWLYGKTIVDIAPNLQPDPSKTEAGLFPYYARSQSTLVLELPAGMAEKYGLKIGDSIEIAK